MQMPMCKAPHKENAEGKLRRSCCRAMVQAHSCLDGRMHSLVANVQQLSSFS